MLISTDRDARATFCHLTFMFLVRSEKREGSGESGNYCRANLDVITLQTDRIAFSRHAHPTSVYTLCCNSLTTSTIIVIITIIIMVRSGF